MILLRLMVGGLFLFGVLWYLFAPSGSGKAGRA